MYNIIFYEDNPGYSDIKEFVKKKKKNQKKTNPNKLK